MWSTFFALPFPTLVTSSFPNLFLHLHLHQCLQIAEGEVEKMAAIAEQEKLKNISLEKQLQTLSPQDNTDPPAEDLQAALQEKEKWVQYMK